MIRMSKRALLRERNDAVIKYNDMNRAADEVNRIVDAILASVVKAYGVDGAITIDAPKVRRTKQVCAERTDDGKLIIRLRSDKDETEGSNPESGRAQAEHD